MACVASLVLSLLSWNFQHVGVPARGYAFEQILFHLAKPSEFHLASVGTLVARCVVMRASE